MVVKVDDLELQGRLGVVGREPRGAIAWKFAPSTANTTLQRIAWNVGRTGHLVPFAQLEPVQVSGVTVKLATLHNEEDLRRKDVREGDEVIVLRAGDVIRRWSRLRQGRRNARTAQAAFAAGQCPFCGTPTVKLERRRWTSLPPKRASCFGQPLPGGQALHQPSGPWTSRPWGRRTCAASWPRG